MAERKCEQLLLIDNHEEPETTVCSSRAPVFQDDSISSSDLARINRIAPKPLRMDQVYVRSMFLCSSQACGTDHCQFSVHALQEIREKIIGQSVLTGHNRSSLPLARFFKAEVVERSGEDNEENTHFVRAWFYWLRETTGAKDLLLNIDGGVYREVSLAWRFHSWRCSICDSAGNQCSHIPGEMYENKKCVRVIEHITDVMEGSLVYKSADKNTVLSGSRSAETGRSDLPVVLISGHDDPVLQYLVRENLCSQQFDLSESTEWLHEGIEQLWCRSNQAEEDSVQFQPFLSEDGVRVFEYYSNTKSPEQAFGSWQTHYNQSE